MKPNPEQAVKVAIDKFMEDDVVIRNEAKVEASRYGAWVEAWVWVSKEELENAG
jgi:hypothetical protein